MHLLLNGDRTVSNEAISEELFKISTEILASWLYFRLRLWVGFILGSIIKKDDRGLMDAMGALLY